MKESEINSSAVKQK